MKDFPEFTDSSAQVLSHHAKSFSWAAWFLPKQTFKKVSTLYHFCRYADDVVDNLNPIEASVRLKDLRKNINANATGDGKQLEMISYLISSGIKTHWLEELVNGVESDLTPAQKFTYDQLIVYCYRVAGVVGLMMCPLMGVRQKEAYPFAVDLGIGMQLTNIARDVATDAKMNRIYIPEPWLTSSKINAEEIISGTLVPQARKKIILMLLDLADRYYESGRKGLIYIPWQPRLAIGVAASIYRQIGMALKRQDLNPWLGRAHTTLIEKLYITLSEISRQFVLTVKLIFMKNTNREPHDSHLHLALQSSLNDGKGMVL